MTSGGSLPDWRTLKGADWHRYLYRTEPSANDLDIILAPIDQYPEIRVFPATGKSTNRKQHRKMKRSIYWAKRIAFVMTTTALIAGGVTSAALAQTCTTASGTNACATVTIPSSITLSLAGNTYTLNITAGVAGYTPVPNPPSNGVTGPAQITATVTANTTYMLTSQLMSQTGSTFGFPGDNPGNIIDSTSIYPLEYSGSTAGNPGTGSFASFYSDGAAATIAAVTGPSANAGDVYPLAIAVLTPGSQAADVYSGVIEYLAAA